VYISDIRNKTVRKTFAVAAGASLLLLTGCDRYQSLPEARRACAGDMKRGLTTGLDRETRQFYLVEDKTDKILKRCYY